MIFRYLGLRDYLRIASQATGQPVDELCTETVLEAAKTVLDAPSAQRRGPSRGDRVVFETLAEKAAVLVSGLLEAPPVTPEAARIAFECLRGFLELNGGALTSDGTVVLLRFQEVRRRPAELASALEWLHGVIEEPLGSGRRSSQQRRSGQKQLFVAVAGELPEIVTYLMGPFPTPDAETRQTLLKLHADLERALIDAAASLHLPCQIRVEQPGIDPPRRRGVLLDRDMWEYVSRLMLEEVDALVLVDSLLECTGSRQCPELDLHQLQGGPILYLRDRSRPGRDRLLTGRRRELDLDVVSYDGTDRIPALARRWLARRAETIVDAARRRDDRLLLYQPLQRRLSTAWRKADAQTRDLAADGASLTFQNVNELLTSVLSLATTAGWRIQALCRELGVAREDRGPASPRGSTPHGMRINFEALLQAGSEHRWASETIFALRDWAMHARNEPRAFATRLRLGTPHDWVVLRDELGV